MRRNSRPKKLASWQPTSSAIASTRQLRAPDDLGGRYRRLRGPLPNLNVLGGCCGTGHRHVAAICAAWPAAG